MNHEVYEPAASQLPRSARELGYEALRFIAPRQLFEFATTAELPVHADWAGQERALAALELGLRIRDAGYNVYVSGLGGTHREQELADLLRRFTADQPTPGDRVLVSESGIYTREDVERLRRAGASAILVGSAIVSAPDPAAKIRELVG